MPPTLGEQAPTFTALLCDGETFQSRTLDSVLGDHGCVVIFYGFSFSAIADNWWKHYARRGWHDFDDVPVVGVSRDGPYAQNAFLRSIQSPFRVFSDVNAVAIDAFDVRTDRHGMANIDTAQRSVFVLDADRTVRYRWIGDDWISPVPAGDIEDAVADLW